MSTYKLEIMNVGWETGLWFCCWYGQWSLVVLCLPLLWPGYWQMWLVSGVAPVYSLLSPHPPPPTTLATLSTTTRNKDRTMPFGGKRNISGKIRQKMFNGGSAPCPCEGGQAGNRQQTTHNESGQRLVWWQENTTPATSRDDEGRHWWIMGKLMFFTMSIKLVIINIEGIILEEGKRSQHGGWLCNPAFITSTAGN